MLKPEKWELKIHGLQKSDQGEYTCIVSNTRGVIKHTFQVDVLDYIRDKPILVGELYESFVLKRALVKYQSQSALIKVMLFFTLKKSNG